MGEFVDGAYRPGPTAEDALHAGLPAGVRARGTEPCARRDLIEKAKQLIPASGPRERGTEPKAPFQGYSAGDRRRITAAAEFIASLDGEQAEMYRDWLAGEQAELDATVGKAEDAREEHAEKIALTLDLADHVEDATAELVEDQRDFLRWAAEAFGGPEALDRWISKQGDAEDQRDALTELAELYVSGDGAIEDADDSEPTEADDIAFSDFVGGAIGEEGIAQLNTLPDAEYDEAIADLSEAFLAAHPEHDDDFEDEDGEEFAGGGWASI